MSNQQKVFTKQDVEYFKNIQKEIEYYFDLNTSGRHSTDIILKDAPINFKIPTIDVAALREILKREAVLATTPEVEHNARLFGTKILKGVAEKLPSLKKYSLILSDCASAFVDTSKLRDFLESPIGKELVTVLFPVSGDVDDEGIPFTYTTQLYDDGMVSNAAKLNALRNAAEEFLILVKEVDRFRNAILEVRETFLNNYPEQLVENLKEVISENGSIYERLNANILEVQGLFEEGYNSYKKRYAEIDFPDMKADVKEALELELENLETELENNNLSPKQIEQAMFKICQSFFDSKLIENEIEDAFDQGGMYADFPIDGYNLSYSGYEITVSKSNYDKIPEDNSPKSFCELIFLKPSTPFVAHLLVDGTLDTKQPVDDDTIAELELVKSKLLSYTDRPIPYEIDEFITKVLGEQILLDAWYKFEDKATDMAMELSKEYQLEDTSHEGDYRKFAITKIGAFNNLIELSTDYSKRETQFYSKVNDFLAGTRDLDHFAKSYKKVDLSYFVGSNSELREVFEKIVHIGNYDEELHNRLVELDKKLVANIKYLDVFEDNQKVVSNLKGYSLGRNEETKEQIHIITKDYQDLKAKKELVDSAIQKYVAITYG